MRVETDERSDGLAPAEYVMARNDADTERGRLRLLESWLDPGTTGRLNGIGIPEAARCLEVGAGRGSIARWLAERVGPRGSVVAGDIDPRFLDDMPVNVEVRRLDIRADEVEAEAYDLVHCRALLMHLPDPVAALQRMVRALGPGGVLLAEEGDFGLHHFGGHPDAARMNELYGRALARLRSAHIMDAWLGRGMSALLADLGLDVLGGTIESAVAAPGEVAYEWDRANVTAVGPRLVAAGVLDEEFLTLAHRFFGAAGTTVTTLSIGAAWARRPVLRLADAS